MTQRKTDTAKPSREEMIAWLNSLHKRLPVESIHGGFYRLTDAAMCQAIETFIASSGKDV
jgi:hypothetical protein